MERSERLHGHLKKDYAKATKEECVLHFTEASDDSGQSSLSQGGAVEMRSKEHKQVASISSHPALWSTGKFQFNLDEMGIHQGDRNRAVV